MRPLIGPVHDHLVGPFEIESVDEGLAQALVLEFLPSGRDGTEQVRRVIHTEPCRMTPQAAPYLCSMGADRRLHREQGNISSKTACSFRPGCSILRQRRSRGMAVLGPRNDETPDPY